MVKPRKKKAPSQSIDDFAAGADKPPGRPDPKAPRNYKYLKLSFNEYEWQRLVAGCDAADRKRLDFIRKAIRDAIDKEID